MIQGSWSWGVWTTCGPNLMHADHSRWCLLVLLKRDPSWGSSQEVPPYFTDPEGSLPCSQEPDTWIQSCLRSLLICGPCFIWQPSFVSSCRCGRSADWTTLMRADKKWHPIVVTSNNDPLFSSHPDLALPRGHFTLVVPTKTLYAFLFRPCIRKV